MITRTQSGTPRAARPASFLTRRLLRWFGPLIAVATAWAVPSAPAAKPAPNILVIVADNWAYPHASFLGDPVVQTPTFDRVARQGIVFDRTFNVVPSCSPSRAALLTGRPPHAMGEVANLWSGFPTRYRVITDDLRDAGYRVGYTGKGWGPGNYVDSGRTTNPAGRRCKDFAQFLAQTPAPGPFFFWLGNTDTASNKWKYTADASVGLNTAAIHVPSYLSDTPEIRATIAGYYDGVRRLDREAGEAIAALAKSGRLDHTIVVYTSDNGWQLPRGLGNCYDSGSRVPLAICGPGIPADRRSGAFVSLGDLGPTILELAGLSPRPEMTYRSIAAIARGEVSGADRDAVFIERERHANVRAGNLSYPIRSIRTARYQYLWNLRPDRWPAGDPQKFQSVGPYGDVDSCLAKTFLLAHADEPAIRPYFTLIFGKRPEEELYDVTADPGEIKNLAADPKYTAIKAELRGRLEQWMADTDDPRVDPCDDRFDHYRYWGDVNHWDKN